jgi:bifunctional non-homologous end joining protein LigD
VERSGAWIKIKLHHEQEFVIGGYTEPEGSRKYLGALLVGLYQGEKLKFAGSVGTGFSDNCCATSLLS